MTPNIAQGANTAIEHAAALANTLHNLAESQLRLRKKLSESEISSALGELCRRHYSHVKFTNHSSRLITRMHARQGCLWSFFGRYIFPWIESRMIVHLQVSKAAQNTTLNFLPAPSPIGHVQTEDWNKDSVAIMGLMVLVAGASYWWLLK